MHVQNSVYSDRLVKRSLFDETLINNAIAPIVGLVSGALAGGIEASVTYPLELAKTQAQLRFNRRWRHLDTASFLRRTVAADGVSSLYTGVGSAVSGAALKVGLRYLVFDGAVHAFKNGNLHSTNIDYAAAGVIAGTAESVLVATPSERIKTAMIDDSNGARRFRSSADAARQICYAEGLSGHFLAEQHKSIFGHSSRSVQDTFVLGAGAGIVTVCVTQPLDVVKTRRQSSRSETLLLAARNVLHTQGVAGFWSGSMFRLGRMSVSSGIVMSVHEKVVDLLKF